MPNVNVTVDIDGVVYTGTLVVKPTEPLPVPPEPLAFRLFTKVTAATLKLLEPHVKPGDLLWGMERGPDAVVIPPEVRALNVVSSDDLDLVDDDTIRGYKAV